MEILSHYTKRDELPILFKRLGFKIGAEIGVQQGKFSEIICKAMPGVHLYCVDPWLPYPLNHRGGGSDRHRRYYKEAQERLMPYDARIMPKMSMDAVREFEDNSLDFVYIDANHDFDFVMEDLISWSRKVRPGGVVSGHDYYHFTNSGVIEAVDVYISMHGIREWYLTDEWEPSFFWIKPENERGKRVKTRYLDPNTGKK